MSPSLSEDLLVRDLHERVERALPPMSLDLANVLVAGRRHRRRRTVTLSAAGALAVGAIAFGALQLAGPQRTEVTPAYPDPAFESGTFSIRVADDTREVETDAGPAVDLGIPVAARWNPIGALTYALRAVDFVDGEPEGAHGTGLWLGSLAGDGTTAMLASGGENAILEPDNRSPLYLAHYDDHDAWLLGVRTPALAGARFDLVVERDGGTERTPVPTFRVPGFGHDVWFVALTDPEVDYATWPFAFIEVTAQDGTTSQWGLDGQELEASGADTLAIEVAQDVQEVETDEGTAVDLGIPVPTVWDPLGQGLTYSLRAGVFVDEEPNTPDTTGLWVTSLAPDGTTSMIGGGSVAEALAPGNRNPIWSSMLSDHDAYLIGIRPPALEGATFDVVRERDDGTGAVPIPTFRVPGLDADVWFVALTDPDVDIRDWPTTSIRVTNPDGTTASWSLAGVAQTTS